MSDKPKRRWYQFSLKTVFIAVTVGCVLIGGRIEWYRRWACYHEKKWAAEKYQDSFHESQAALYRKAMWRPWMMVWEKEQRTYWK